MSRLLLLLALCGFQVASADCTESCVNVCPDHFCKDACKSACGKVYSYTGEPYFRLELIQTFPFGTIVTGSDSPAKPQSRNIFFTTLDGTVYRYNAEKGLFNTVLKVPTQQMDGRHGKGLYDIAFHRDYHKNGRIYLHYAAPPPQESVDRFRDHDNVVVEYESSGLQFDFVREIKRIPQYTSERSGGWAKMGQRDGYVHGKVWLYLAVGGNKEELISRNQGSPALSSIYAIAEPNDRSQVLEKVWASGIQNPLDCDASDFKLGRVQCLIEDSQGQRHVHSLRKGYNYGSDEYVNECSGRSCAQQYAALASRNAVVSFNTSECPVQSIQMYTGHKMRNYHLDIFLTRDACYKPGSNEFKPAEILRIYRDHSAAAYKTIVMPTDMRDDLLMNTTLVGADRFDDFYIAGYALRTSEFGLYRIVPVKAAN